MVRFVGWEGVISKEVKDQLIEDATTKTAVSLPPLRKGGGGYFGAKKFRNFWMIGLPLL